MPIDSLSSSVEATILSLAPERAGELACSEDAKKLSFNWTDDPGRLPSVKLPAGAVSIPRPGAELIWSASLLYWVLYSEYLADQEKGYSHFNLFGNGRRLTAQVTYTCASARFQNPSLPRFIELPDPDQRLDEDVAVANELFLAAVGWILHHEFAHVRCAHPPITAISYQEEKQADIEATKWIFDQAKDEPQRKKRALGMCVAILLLTAKGLEEGNFDDITHPKAFDRLDYCLQAAELDDDHIAFAFSTVMIRYHLVTNQHLDLPVDREGQTLREIFSDHLFEVFKASSKEHL